MVIQDTFLDILDNNDFDTEIINNLSELESKFNHFNNKFHNNFKLLHTNIRSILKNFDELLVYINELNYELDFIALLETRYVDNLNFYNIPGYTAYFNNREK